MYTTILFDLDGTITDSEPGITACVQYALRKFGIEVEDKSTLRPFIGPPLRDSFEQYFDMTPEQAEQATAYYRERYAPIGKFESTLYPGIESLLQKLHRSGRTVVLATSKPEHFAREILDHFGLTEYFDLIGGATMDGSRDTKEDVLSYILTQLPPNARARAVMVGDTRFDMLGARHHSLPAIGVLYGFGSKEELLENGARALAADAAELEQLLFEP
jgi:phosphoglycolate phosphatase